jgi:hypothetical protein
LCPFGSVYFKKKLEHPSRIIDQGAKKCQENRGKITSSKIKKRKSQDETKADKKFLNQTLADKKINMDYKKQKLSSPAYSPSEPRALPKQWSRKGIFEKLMLAGMFSRIGENSPAAVITYDKYLMQYIAELTEPPSGDVLIVDDNLRQCYLINVYTEQRASYKFPMSRTDLSGISLVRANQGVWAFLNNDAKAITITDFRNSLISKVFGIGMSGSMVESCGKVFAFDGTMMYCYSPIDHTLVSKKMPRIRKNAAVVVSGDLIYLFAGTHYTPRQIDIDIYNPVTESWSSISTEAAIEGTVGNVGAIVEGILYAFNRFGHYECDLATGVWTSHMVELDFEGLYSFAVGSDIYIVGHESIRVFDTKTLGFYEREIILPIGLNVKAGAVVAI